MSSREVQDQNPNAVAPVQPVDLSDREREILVLVANGASNKEVAQQLAISPNTVKVHLRNIFGKIGVSSRTEAALYAVRTGLVQVAAEVPAPAENAAPELAAASAPPAAPPAAVPTPRVAPRPMMWVAAALVLVLIVVGSAWGAPRLLAPDPTMTPTRVPRWQMRAALAPARSRLATVAHEGQIYAIAGETGAGVSGLNTRYDPAANVWTTLAAKPVPVADVGAAVLGGLIYVPGGRLSSGENTDVVEVYDPGANEWSTRAPLPVPLSGYALASVEGRLYLLGGWNGSDFVASVYEYDPGDDAWSERTRMPTARGFAAAAAAGGKIYVIGGTDASGPSRAMEVYIPARDSEVANPWETMPDLPTNQSLVAATSLAETIYVVGRPEAGDQIGAWAFYPQRSEWQPLELTTGLSPEWLGVAALQTHLYVLGAPQEKDGAGQFLAYQALYTSLIPVLTSGEGEPAP